jgi:membrane glycosyltransferase
LFVIPEEFQPPTELRSTWRVMKRAPALPDFVAAVMDPVANALACASEGVRPQQPLLIRNARLRLARHALREGPDHLTAREKITLLSDPLALSQLHFDAWSAPDAHATWRRAQVVPESSDHHVIAFPSANGEPQLQSLPTR